MWRFFLFYVYFNVGTIIAMPTLNRMLKYYVILTFYFIMDCLIRG
jgi:hypothetical protein